MDSGYLAQLCRSRAALPRTDEADLLAALAVGRLQYASRAAPSHYSPGEVVKVVGFACYNEFEVLAVLRDDDRTLEALAFTDLNAGNDWLRGPTWRKLMNALR